MTLATARVHPPLPDARPAKGLPPHPPLWPARHGNRAANIAHARELLAVPSRSKQPDTPEASDRRTARAAASMPLLRRPHDHHRDLRARLPAEAPPHACSGSDQDRHLMMPSPRSTTAATLAILAGSQPAATTRVASAGLARSRRQIPSCNVPDRSFTPTRPSIV